ncbi:MAG: YceI family protein [Candidatus Kapaibacterium sp.]
MAWNIDPSHSQVQFTVRHMMISNARGRFEEFTGTVEFDPEHLENLKVDVTIDAASINTRDPQRDGHLKSPDFLNVEQFPNMTFKSTSVEKVSNTELHINGDLTIRDTTHPVVLQTEFNGVVASPWGTTSAGFSAHTKINRKEWGLVWNQTLETGGLLVGEDVKIELELELVKAPVAEAVA